MKKMITFIYLIVSFGSLFLPGCGVNGSIKSTTSEASSNLASSNAILNGGNSFGSTINIGSNDAYDINFLTAGLTQMKIKSGGGVLIDSTSYSDFPLILKSSTDYTSLNVVNNYSSATWHSAAIDLETFNVTDTNSAHSSLNLYSHRGPQGSSTASQTNDQLGSMDFYGDDGGSNHWILAGSIAMHAAGNFNTSSGPGNMYFGTTPSGASTPTTRMTILSNGNVGIGSGATVPQTTLQVDGIISPTVNNSYTLGNATYRFTTVYATNGTINTSDRREKKQIQNSNLGLDFINKLRPVSYLWNTGVDSDVHYGLIAQETESVLHSKLGKSTSTSIISYDEKSDRYGLRYSELIAPLIKAVQEVWVQVISVMDQQSQQAELIQKQKREIAILKEENQKILKRLDALEKKH